MCSDPVILRGSFMRRGACALVRCRSKMACFLLELTLRSVPDLIINIVLSAFVHVHKILISLMIVKARRPNGQYK